MLFGSGPLGPGLRFQRRNDMTSDKDAILAELENGVKGLQQEVAVEAARKALAAGMNPVEAIENGLAKGIREVGEKFARKEMFVVELIYAAEIMSAAIQVLEPEMKRISAQRNVVGRMVLGQKAYLPCTPHGVIQLLVRSGVKLKGAHVVVVGRSNIVGKPLANMLVQKNDRANATVTICHTGTKDMTYHTRRADILIVAAGKPKAVTADMVKEGAVVIDVGVNRIGVTPEGKAKLCGDVDFEGVKEKASAITPVPGGVGPMTITMLMMNTVKAAKLHAGIN